MQKYKDFIYYNRKELLMIFLCLLVVLNFFYKNDNNKMVEDEIVSKFEKENENEEEKTSTTIIVDIKGEINNPGTYELKEDERIKDVIEKAGGLTNKANVDNINLSEKVKDEMVVIVPSIGDNKEKEDNNKNNNNSYVIKNNETNDNKVSINNASLQTLMTIKGIGEKKAEAIIEYRNKNGQFKTIEDIINVSGIGKSTFEKIKDYIKL